MQSFDIESYKVSSELQRFPGATRASRVLEMTGPVQFHGIQNHATLRLIHRSMGCGPTRWPVI